MATTAAPQPLVVVGTGGNALDVLDIVAALECGAPRWWLAGALDDELPAGETWCGLAVLGRLSDAPRLAGRDGSLADAAFLNAIGSDRNHASRAEIVGRTGLSAERFATLVHPGASVSPRARLGRGCCVGFGVSIGGQVQVGDHAWIGPGCVVGHDSVLEPFAMMAPRSVVSGFVRLGTGSYIGSGAALRQRVTVGAGALVGIGAVVLRDVPAGAVVAGNPARELRRAPGNA